MTYRRFPKMGLVCDCDSHLILAAVSGRGPTPDHPHLIEALLDAAARRRIDTLLADAGYDAEWVHAFLRDELDIRSIIPPTIGRPTDKPPTGRYRRQMAKYFKRPPARRRYGQRWQVETVFSMIKRRLGETLSARSYHRQNRALLLKAVVHNILILLWPKRFSTEHSRPLFPDGLIRKRVPFCLTMTRPAGPMARTWSRPDRSKTARPRSRPSSVAVDRQEKRRTEETSPEGERWAGYRRAPGPALALGARTTDIRRAT